MIAGALLQLAGVAYGLGLGATFVRGPWDRWQPSRRRRARAASTHAEVASVSFIGSLLVVDHGNGAGPFGSAP